VIPGEVIAAEGDMDWLPERARATVTVLNTGDRPIQVGSHFHFADVNPALDFDRAAAQLMRLDLPAGTSSRFEPGVSKQVTLVALGGARRVPGLQIRHQ
jgi:urease beta subunit